VQAIYPAPSRAQAEAEFRRFRARWQHRYPSVVKRLGQDLPELLSSLSPGTGGAKLHAPNVIDAACWKFVAVPTPWCTS
jgi:transposase-like protein